MRISLCQQCGTRIKPRNNKRFCSDRCRWQAHEAISEPCFYCGVPADTTDHVPPRSVRGELMALNITQWEFVEVPACHECNCALGARALWTLPSRKAWIKRWLRKRYARLLVIPEWTEVERADISERLNAFIDEGLFAAQVAHRRIKW
jgi:hypothetical protein